VSKEELIELLKWAYGRIPSKRLGESKLIDYDPAGSTYEFTEFEQSKKIRELLGYKHEPSGI